MEVVTRVEKGIAIVHAVGELDLAGAANFRDKLDDLIDQQIARQILLNLEDLTFMDSTGLGILLGRYKKLALVGGKLALCNVSPQIEKIFRLSGLLKLVDLYDTEEEALELLREGRL